MRIIGGTARGRSLNTPTGNDIRPTSDKVRLAIFNALFSRGGVADKIVLDAFCGTGALGLEALSQGAAQCYFFDKSRISLDLTKGNARNIGFDTMSIFNLKDVTKIVGRPTDIVPADIIFLDPPYRQGLIPLALTALSNGQWISKEAIIVIEAESEFAIPAPYFVLFNKGYGDTRVCFLQYQI